MRTVSRLAAAAAASMALALPLAAGAAVYSNASLKGSYSFLLTLRTADVATPTGATLGIIVFDGAGNATVTAKGVSEGVVTTNTPVSGGYSVSADGLGTLNITGGPQFAIQLAASAGGIATDVQILRTDDTSNEILSGHAVLQSTKPVIYKLESAKGTYFFTNTISTAVRTLPQAEGVGVVTTDGKGNLTTTGTQVYDGTSQIVPGTGTYTINSDGTGTSTVTSGASTTTYINVLNSKGYMSVATNITANLIETVEGVK